jgi:hypothetical protein
MDLSISINLHLARFEKLCTNSHCKRFCCEPLENLSISNSRRFEAGKIFLALGEAAGLCARIPVMVLRSIRSLTIRPGPQRWPVIYIWVEGLQYQAGQHQAHHRIGVSIVQDARTRNRVYSRGCQNPGFAYRQAEADVISRRSSTFFDGASMLGELLALRPLTDVVITTWFGSHRQLQTKRPGAADWHLCLEYCFHMLPPKGGAQLSAMLFVAGHVRSQLSIVTCRPALNGHDLTCSFHPEARHQRRNTRANTASLSS